MNERIEKLASEAGFNFWGGEHWKPQGAVIDWSCVYDEELEKFAKLIAKKCINMIQNEAAQYSEPVWAVELVNDIKDHFGLEQL